MGKVQGLERLLQGTATVESVEAKADKTHTHAIADVSGLPEELENKADHHHGIRNTLRGKVLMIRRIMTTRTPI